IGAGSYAGPRTMLIEIKDGKLQHVPAKDPEGGKEGIELTQSLKNGWQIVPGLNDYCITAKFFLTFPPAFMCINQFSECPPALQDLSTILFHKC
ncbi:MAG: hypothetical protein Q8926_09610, partial [Bacteroidota bacterium]|nr:hypothetical protein [Bacteroidota bacterium]